MSLNWPMPWIATRALTLLSLAMCIIVVRVSAEVVAAKSGQQPMRTLIGQPANA